MQTTKSKVCPIDQRRFATAAALEQHRRDAHPAQSGAKPKVRPGKARKGAAGSAPLALRQYRGPQSSSSITVSGSDLLASLTVDKDVAVGTRIAELLINPRFFEGTRLTQQARLYTRWRPRTLELVIQTTLPSTAGGQLAAGWTADPNEIWPTNAVSLARKVMMLRPSVMCHMWEVAKLRLPVQTVQTWLYCQDEGPDSDQGKVIVVLTGQPTSVTGAFNVTLTLNWTVEFQSPDMPSSIDDPDYAKADEGYYPYFTTGSKFLASDEKLTLECSAAGGASSIVRFSMMLPDVVYTPVEAKQLKAYTDKTTEGAVGALVRVKDVPEPYVYCFADEAKARLYISSGSLEHVMSYYKAGSWATGNPLWKRKAAAALLTNVGGRLVSARLADPDQGFNLRLRTHDEAAELQRLMLQKLLHEFVLPRPQGFPVSSLDVTVTNKPTVFTVPLPIPPEAQERSESVSSFDDVGSELN